MEVYYIFTGARIDDPNNYTKSQLPEIMDKKLRVLVVEDDPVLRRAFSRALRDWSADVTEASDLSAGREALKAHPDLIILDIGLPDGSGVTLAEEISCMAPLPMCIAVSGEATAGEAFKLKELGVLGFIPKPLSLEDFTATLDRILQTPVDLEPHLKAHVGKESFRDVQRAVRRSMVEQALGLSRGNLTHAASMLNVSRQAVQQMIRDFNLTGYLDALQLEHKNNDSQGDNNNE